MIWLVLGVALFALVHLSKSLVPYLRLRLIKGMGEGPYKGVFALSIFASVALIVFGWRSTEPEAIYFPETWTGHAALLLMAVAFVFVSAANRPTALRRYVRHPMLTGTAIWAATHLLANGDDRSLVLFGGLGLWALVEIPLVSARECEWLKPEAPAFSREVLGLIITAVVFVVVLILHPYFAGVSPLPW